MANGHWLIAEFSILNSQFSILNYTLGVTRFCHSAFFLPKWQTATQKSSMAQGLSKSISGNKK